MLHLPSRRPAHARCRPQTPVRRLWLEQLEDRLAPAVSVSISDTSLVEGNSGTTNMVFTITRTGDTSSNILVGYTTEDGTAIAGLDYVPNIGNALIAAGSSTGTISIGILGNTVDELDKTFSVRLTGISGPTGATFFGTRQDFSEGPGGSFHLGVADLNGDGKQDIIAPNANSNTLSILLNTTTNGVFGFATFQNITLSGSPIRVATGDLNGDTKPDLFVAHSNGSLVSILMNTTANGSNTVSFAPVQTITLPTNTQVFSVAIGDLNDDGINDLALANPTFPRLSLFLSNTPAGSSVFTFTDQKDLTIAAPPSSVVILDINKDGINDIATADANSNVSVWLNQTTSTSTVFSIGAQQDFTVAPADISSLTFADLNGDTRLDLVGIADNGSLIVLRNTTPDGATSASFATPQVFAATGNPLSVAVGDLDGDSRLDVIVSSSVTSTVSIFLSTTPQTGGAVSFATRIDLATASIPRATLVDLNGDGWPDIVEGASGNIVAVHLNNAAIITDDLATGTILNDDAPVATLSLLGSPLDEDGGVATVTATLDKAPTLADVTITLGFTGTASAGDYSASATSIVIPIGQLTGSITLTGVDDLLDEAPETIAVAILSVTGGTENGTQQVTATITDDDPTPTISFNLTGSPLLEDGGVATLTATLAAVSGLDVEVFLSFAGTASAGDYTASGTSILIPAGQLSGSIDLTGMDDALDEAPETILVNVDSVINAIDPTAPTQLTATITDDDPPPNVTLSVNGSPIAENGGIAVVTATLNAVSGQAVTVFLAFSGSAGPGEFLPSATSIVIPAGALSNFITLTGLNDFLDEPNETVIIDISSVTNGVEFGTQQVTVTITDDDPPPLVTLGLVGSPLAENGGVATVSAVLSTTSAFDVTVTLGFSGSASGTDYTASASSILILAGSLLGSITLTGVDDLLDEANETIIVDITSVTNGTESGTQQVIATITDDDSPPEVTLSLTGSPIAENGGVATVTATLSTVSALDVQIFLGFSGTAASSDYTRSATLIIIPAGSLTGSITLTGLNDALNEALETVVVDVTTVVNGLELNLQQITAHIVDDDPLPSVQFTAAAQTAVESDGDLAITVQLSTLSGRDVVVPFTKGGTAGASESTLTASPLLIPAGSLSATITLSLVDDPVAEGQETIIVSLQSSLQADPGSTTTHTVTVLDNDFSVLVFGSDAGSPSNVQILAADTFQSLLVSPLSPYGPTYRGGVRVALGDVNGDHIPDIVTAPGMKLPGGSVVKVFDGRNLIFGTEPQEIASFAPYGTLYRKELSIAVGDLTGDGSADIVIANNRRGPMVSFFDGATVVAGTPQELEFPFQPFGFRYRGGLRVALGTVNNDTIPDIIISQASNGSGVRILDGANPRFLLTSFRAAPTPIPGGVFVAGVRIDGDPTTEIVVGYGRGAKSTVRVYQDNGASDTKANLVGKRNAVYGGFLGGVRVAGLDIDQDGFQEILTSAGPGSNRPIRILNGFTLQILDQVFATPLGAKPGLYLAAGRMG